MTKLRMKLRTPSLQQRVMLPSDYRERRRQVVAQPLDAIKIVVKAKKGAVIYDLNDMPISDDEFTAVALTPTVALAIDAGDLIAEGEAEVVGGEPHERRKHKRSHRRKRRED